MEQPVDPAIEAPIRSERRLAISIVALIFGPILVLVPIGLGLFIFLGTKPSITSGALLLLFAGGSAFIAYHMLQNNHWVEFDGTCIRTRRFWTRQLIDQYLEDVVDIRALGAVACTSETIVIDKLLGPVRGYEIRFKSGPGISLMRGDMKRVDELVIAIARAVRQRDEARQPES